jgi:hypothetical protein
MFEGWNVRGLEGLSTTPVCVSSLVLFFVSVPVSVFVSVFVSVSSCIAFASIFAASARVIGASGRNVPSWYPEIHP